MPKMHDFKPNTIGLHNRENSNTLNERNCVVFGDVLGVVVLRFSSYRDD